MGYRTSGKFWDRTITCFIWLLRRLGELMTHKTKCLPQNKALLLVVCFDNLSRWLAEIMAPSISLESLGTLETCFCRPCLGLLSVLPCLPPVIFTFLLDWPLVFPDPLILFAGLPVVEWPEWIALIFCHFMLQIPDSAGPLDLPPMCLAEIGQRTKKYLLPLNWSRPHEVL